MLILTQKTVVEKAKSFVKIEEPVFFSLMTLNYSGQIKTVVTTDESVALKHFAGAEIISVTRYSHKKTWTRVPSLLRATSDFCHEVNLTQEALS